jgi:hypothetical protein
MLRLAVAQRRIGANDLPYFPNLADSDPVVEYITPEQFARVLAALPTAASKKEYNRTHERKRVSHAFTAAHRQDEEATTVDADRPDARAARCKTSKTVPS